MGTAQIRWGMSYDNPFSYPPSASINDHIDPQFTSVTYSSFDTVVQTMSTLGQGVLIARPPLRMLFAKYQYIKATSKLMGLTALINVCPLCIQYRANSLSTVLEWVVKFLKHKSIQLNTT